MGKLKKVVTSDDPTPTAGKTSEINKPAKAVTKGASSSISSGEGSSKVVKPKGSPNVKLKSDSSRSPFIDNPKSPGKVVKIGPNKRILKFARVESGKLTESSSQIGQKESPPKDKLAKAGNPSPVKGKVEVSSKNLSSTSSLDILSTKAIQSVVKTATKRVLKYARPNTSGSGPTKEGTLKESQPKEKQSKVSTPTLVTVKIEPEDPSSIDPPPPLKVKSGKRILKYARPQETELRVKSVTGGVTRSGEKVVVKKAKAYTAVMKSSEIKITKIGPSIATIDQQEKQKENFTISKLYNEMKENCVISDRWCIPEPMWDPQSSREVLLCYELDVLQDGSVRMKRCIKVLEDFELIVLLDGTDKTYLFKEKHPTIGSSQDLCDLIRKVTMVKVCSGVKDCDPSDIDSLPVKVIERAGSWFSSECNVEVEKGCLGNICRKCTSLRNSLRRKMRRQYGIESSNTSSSNTPSNSSNRTLLSNSMKPVMKTVGEALYSNLQHMSGSKACDEITIPLPRSATQVLHPELKIYMNSDLKQRLDEVASNPPAIAKIEHIMEFDPRTMTKTLKRIQSPLTSFRNTVSSNMSRMSKRVKTEVLPNQSFVLGNNGELTLVSGETIQLPEGYVLADDNNPWGENVVVQKIESSQDEQFILGDDNGIIVGSNFTLEDGEEYEVIGEAPSDDNIQMLPLGNNSDIEIIEVDENMIQLVDDNNQPEITPIDSSSDIFKFLQAHRLQV